MLDGMEPARLPCGERSPGAGSFWCERTGACMSNETPSPSHWRTRAMIVVAMVTAVVAVLLLTAVLTTSYAAYPLTVFNPGTAQPPRWIAPCRHHHKGGPPYALPCARVDARVVYVQGVDPDGDHDVHVVAVAGARPVIVKFRRGRGRPPSLSVGDRLRATGTLSKGRFSIAEITATDAH